MENKRELKGFLEKWLPKTYGEMIRDEINLTNVEANRSLLVMLISSRIISPYVLGNHFSKKPLSSRLFSIIFFP